jgi:PA14 domain/PKD domain/Tetratricopeptide repeat
MNRAGSRTLTLLVLLALAAPTFAGPKGWWDRDFSHRKRVVLSEVQDWPDAEAAHVRLSTGGRARVDGRDIRVIASSGKEVPRGVVAFGPGDLYEVAFPIGKETEWFVYFGNPDAPEPPETWLPDRGLILETRARGAGTPNNWAGMEKILARSTRIFGGSFWPRVFDAENPFGSSDNFVSDYRGFIQAPVDGTYTFYTASDEASFLFVAGKMVAQWPGWHDATRGAHAVFRGTAVLTAGLHRFRYIHIERTGRQAMAAYWKVPGAEKAVVIPPSAFPGLKTAQMAEAETLGKDFAADFESEVTDKWGLDERVFTALAFKAVPVPGTATYHFDFGDGVSGDGPIAAHVYLTGGEYDVALTVESSGERDTVIRTIHVPDEWTRFDRNHPEVLARFGRMVATYPGARLSAPTLVGAEFLLEEAGREEDLARILKDAVENGRTLKGHERFAAASRLGEILRDRRRDMRGAVWAFKSAAVAGNPAQRLSAQVRAAEAMLQLGGDPKTALRMLDMVMGSLLKGGGDTRQRALLRMGDAEMLLGNGKAARKAYREALDLAGGVEDTRRILRKAGAARAALTQIESGEKDRVLESLAEWEWSDPTERYTGLHRIACAKALLLRLEAPLAERELLGLLRGNPESEYADQALYLLSSLERERGNEEAAKAYLERLKKEYPWSPLVR